MSEKIEKNAQETEKISLQNVLAHNTSAYVTEIDDPEEIGDVLLTGATGFLGIHVLKYLLDHTKKMVYCLILPGKERICKKDDGSAGRQAFPWKPPFPCRSFFCL